MTDNTDPIVTMDLQPLASWYVCGLRAAFKQNINLPTLGRKVFIVGLNGAGKSAVGMAVDLAVTGRAPGIDATGSGLMECAPEDGDEAFAEATLHAIGAPNKARVKYGTKRRGRGATKPSAEADGLPPGVYFEHVGTVLTREVELLLGRAKKTQRAALVKVVAPENLLDGARELIAENHRAEYDKFVTRAEQGLAAANGDDDDEGGGDATEADILVATRDLLDKAVSDARKDAKKDKDAPMPQAPTESELAALQQSVTDLRAALEGRARYNTALQHQGIVQARVRSLEEQVNAAAVASGADPDLAAQVAVAEAQNEKTAEILRQIKALLTYATPVLEQRKQEQGNEASVRCPCCRRQTSDLTEAWALLNHDVGQLVARQDKVKAARDSIAPSSGAQAIQKNLDAARRELVDVEAILQAYTPAEGTVGASPESLTAAEQALSAAQMKGEELKAWEQQRNDIALAEARVDDLSALAKAVGRAITLKLEKCVGDFEASANEAIGQTSDWRVRVVLFEGKKSVTKIGMSHGAKGPVRTWKALSGAQQALLFSAVATALSKRSKKLVRLVRIDDVALDEETAGIITHGLDRATDIEGGPTQAFVSSLAISAGFAADLKSRGWQVIYAPATAAVTGESKAGNGVGGADLLGAGVTL